jgi:hypothetical protein
MNEPVPIHRDVPLLTLEEQITLDRARNARRMGWVFAGLIVLIVAAFLIPLSVFLTRLALGG